MRKITKILLIIIIILIVALALSINMYFNMKEIAKQNLDGFLNSTEDVWKLNNKMTESQTFYAVIEYIDENNVAKVQGLSVNDVNYRGEFMFTIEEDTEIMLRYDNIDVKDLEPGDIVAITFSGPILETSPAGLSEINKIQLLVYEEESRITSNEVINEASDINENNVDETNTSNTENTTNN